ncbi:MAG: hypothetical protein AMXMBFR84_37170 [Candidatus Hydrogenedentota bacterium]
MFIVISLCVLLAAWNSGQSLYYLLFAGLASFLLLSFVLSRKNLQSLDVSREAPYAVHRDAAFSVVIRIENKNKFFPAVLVRAETSGMADSPLGYVLSIPSREAGLLRVRYMFPRRGVHPLPGLDLVTTFPFGLFEARRHTEESIPVVVYPRVLAARTAMVEQARSSGRLQKTIKGDGDEFFSLREYVPGDDLRHIAWRPSARHGKMLVKELEQQTSRNIMFLFDTADKPDVPHFDERFEDVVELIASLAVTLINRQYHVAVRTQQGSISDGEGQTHILKLLEFLARVTPTDAAIPLDVHNFDADRYLSCFYITPDFREWGRMRSGNSMRVLDPGEVIHV